MLWQCARVLTIVFALCHLSAKEMEAFAKTERAIWSIVMIVDEDARNAFLGELPKFANKEAFAIRISQLHQNKKQFFIHMRREDVNIDILNSFDDDPSRFDCFFYQTGIQPVPDAVVNALAKHLRTELSLIPGVVFEEKNCRNCGKSQ
ncbi:hypothetical protein [Bradyrhizobium sp. AUGA SZCCT0431]|uniref:hypothetical protein n=1 Tax=Bradyrhizobium sp. AUGA SZCCT0431 TaxID=2807674 RepID=UPI001BA4EB31|nr:hypothetical protein [Bradyrhizobium sp. AUGA SZCCT0431]MBR1148833.1 hypothetical protein [Bradyrhizobium sp. AUGA SZCCT0431]